MNESLNPIKIEFQSVGVCSSDMFKQNMNNYCCGYCDNVYFVNYIDILIEILYLVNNLMTAVTVHPSIIC